jgi:hypothetical protein
MVSFDHYSIAWSIVRPKSGLVPVLAAKGWKTLYADKWAVVQARPDALNTEPPAPPSVRETTRP